MLTQTSQPHGANFKNLSLAVEIVWRARASRHDPPIFKSGRIFRHHRRVWYKLPVFFTMVRRLEQCVTCQRRFISKSSAAPLCPNCQKTHDEMPTHPPPISTTIDLLSQDSEEDHDSKHRPANDLDYDVHDDDDDVSSSDEDDDLPLATLLSKREILRDSEPLMAPNMQEEGETPLEPIIDFEGPSLSVVQGKNEELKVCNVCGACLTHIASWNGRLNHLKRCSQHHGVTAQQMQAEDPGEENVPVQTNTKTAPEKPKSITQLLMAGARRKAIQEKHKTEAVANKKPRRGGWQQQRKTRSGSCPDYKRIPGTDFVVDGFYYATPSLTSNYFLSHFHADHYGGLTKSWSAGIIYCSSITANLVQQQLYVQRKFLHVLPMNQTMTLETRSGKKVKVTLVDANHCPGAVLFLFQVGEQTILHVGDFRWNRAQHLSSIHSLLQGRRLDQIYFDTTYCDPKHTLPTQQEAIDATVEYAVAQVQEAKKKRQRLLLLFGAYTIGKERIYMAVAKALGMKVYVDARRYRILQALEWPEQERALITRRVDETMLWVVPLGHISMKKLPSYTHAKIGQTQHTFDRVIGFRPTGWSLKSGKSKSKKDENDLLTLCHRGSVTSCSVPYSEHSAFPELVDCLACLQPRIIVPTVSVRKSQEQIDLLLEHLENK
eukprot:scaffold7349_cov173-Amphora_coffeaeformis.AAC.73